MIKPYVPINVKSHATIHRVDSIVTLVELCMNAERYELVRGDVIVSKFEKNHGYRSCGLYFFDGARLISQCTDYDDYGTVPKKFGIITEFPPGYWDLSPTDINNYRDYASSADGTLQISTPADVSKCAYWHAPSNVGTSPIVVDADGSSITTGTGDTLITMPANVSIVDHEGVCIIIIELHKNSNHRPNKYAIVTSERGNDVKHITALKRKLRNDHVWWVSTYDHRGEIASKIGVDEKNILYSY
jgi:hypothetical protein